MQLGYHRLKKEKKKKIEHHIRHELFLLAAFLSFQSDQSGYCACELLNPAGDHPRSIANRKCWWLWRRPSSYVLVTSRALVWGSLLLKWASTASYVTCNAYESGTTMNLSPNGQPGREEVHTLPPDLHTYILHYGASPTLQHPMSAWALIGYKTTRSICLYARPKYPLRNPGTDAGSRARDSAAEVFPAPPLAAQMARKGVDQGFRSRLSW